MSPAIVSPHVEGVFQVVKVANLQIAIDGVLVLRAHNDILHLRATGALQADRELADCHSFADHGEQRSATPRRILRLRFVRVADDARNRWHTSASLAVEFPF